MSAPKPGVGHNQAPDDTRRDVFASAITLWVENFRLDMAMERKELGGLEGIQRHLALSKSLIANMVRLCRAQKRADCRSAILLLITLLSDNNDGQCSLSTTRMAELLDRDQKTIRNAIDSLQSDGLIFVIRLANGLPNSYYPAVPPAVATMNPNVTWFVKALSSERPWGRPSRETLASVYAAAEKPGAQTSGDLNKPGAQTSGDYRKTPGADGKNPGRGAAQESSLHFSRVDGSRLSGEQTVLDEIQRSFYWLCSRWGVTGDEPPRVTEDQSRRRFESIIRKVRTGRSVSDDVMLACVESVLAAMETTKATSVGFNSGAKYFEQALIGALDDAVLNEQEFAAKVAMAQEGLDRRPQGGPRRPKASSDDIFEAACRSFKGGRA